MKRYIYRFFALLTTVLGAWAFAGCADDGDTFMTEESGCFNLVVTVPDESATRATDAELTNNEFKVTKLHFYFYKSADHDDAESVAVYDYEWTGEFNTTQDLTVPLPADALLDGGLFDETGTECIVYAVANVDEATPPDGPQTIDNLKATVIGSSFDTTKTQPSFAMDGKAPVTIDRATRRATGEITLARAAAKITLAVNVAEITVPVPGTKGITYTPNTGSMRVWIGNGVKKSKLNTAPVKAEAADLYSNAVVTTDGNGTGFKKDETAEKYKYIQNVPFYSYPNQWDPTSPDGNCYLTLVLPWSYTDAADNSQQITTYYRIPVQLKDCKIERNMHYDIRVTIARLGSTEPQKPIDVDVEWNYAIPWNTHGELVDIKQVRYLLLNNNNYDDALGAYAFDMDNTTEISIPVGTSHDVEIAEVTMSWIDYRINPPKSRTITLESDGAYKYSDFASYNKTNHFAGLEMNNSTSRLELTRELVHILGSDSDPVWVKDDYEWQQVNGSWQEVLVPAHWEGGASITSNDALNSYTFDIKLQHADDASQTAMVHITQYPPIYITAEETASGNYRFVNKNNTQYNHGTQRNPIYKGCVDTHPRNSEYDLGEIGQKSNHHTYIITISRFASTEIKDYVIADPRTRSVNNLPANSYDSPDDVAAWSMSDGNNKQLQYYYPADDSDTKTRYIAPKLRIASQWGVTSVVTQNGAKRRCASYQENGRPAGRWRLPTKAEIEYIANLSCKGYIPYLFGDPGGSADYWCASGAINVINSNPPKVENTTGSTHYARCVYDEWYWGDDVLTDKTTFTWGDRPRTTSGN